MNTIPAQHTRQAPSGDYYIKPTPIETVPAVEWEPFVIVMGLIVFVVCTLCYLLSGTFNVQTVARVISCDRHVAAFSDAGTALGDWHNIYVDDARYGRMSLVDSKLQNIDATYDCYINEPAVIQPEVGMAPDPNFNEHVRVFAGRTLMAEWHHVRVDDARYNQMDLHNRFGQEITCVYDNYTVAPEGADGLVSQGTGGNF